jgi:hypothetical protein
VRHGRYASDLAALNADDIRVEGVPFRPTMQATDTQYEIRVEGFKNVVLRVQQDGRVW